MIKKRIAAAVVVKNNRVVQSIAYKKYLPVGTPENVIQNLDRWSVDDIVLLDIDRSPGSLGPNYDLIKKISSIPISTPLTYGGGISSARDAIKVIATGAERIILDNLFLNDPKKLKTISKSIGSQAIIVCLPIKFINDDAFHYNYVNKKITKLKLSHIKRYENFISELLIVDVDSEGSQGNFNNKLVDIFSDININLICYGGVGLSQKGTYLLENNQVNAIAYGNILNYGELFFQKIKKSLGKSKQKLRRSIFREKI